VPWEILLALLLLLLLQGLLTERREEREDVEDEDDRGGEVVVSRWSTGDLDLVRAIFGGGGCDRVWPNRPCGNTSFGPKLGFKMLSMEKGKALLTWNALSWLCGDATGLGNRGCDSNG